MAHDRAEKLRHVGLVLNEVGVLYEILGPGLIAHRIGRDDRAGRKRAIGDKHLRAHWHFCRGHCLRRTRAGKHAPGSKGRTDRNDKRPYQQQQLFRVHGFNPAV